MNRKMLMPSGLALELFERIRKNDLIPFIQRDDQFRKANFTSKEVADAISPTNEFSKFKMLERKYVDQFLPEICEYYDDVRKFVSSIYGDAILSPFYRSSINVHVYDLPGSRHAAHYDTNPIANLLCLHEGIPLQVLINGRYWSDVPLVPGELLSFEGRELMHRVPPCLDGNYRAVASLNIYFPDDCSRPEGLDEIAYAQS